MTLTTFCYVIGVVELLIGFPMLLTPRRATQWVLQLKKDLTLVRIVTALFLVMSVLVLTPRATIGTDVPGLVRLLAWLVAIKSLIFCWWPGWHTRLSERLLAKPVVQRPMGAFAVAFGVLLLLAANAM